MAAELETARAAGSLFPGDVQVDADGLLRIIATSDLHTQLLSYDYFVNRRMPGTGLAQIACLIAEARRTAPASLLLDNGDFLQGGALGEVGASRQSKRPHPAITAFRTLDYDAVALGNHEFDYGLDSLARALSDANFPVLSANVLHQKGADPLSDQHLAQPAALLRREIMLAGGERREITIGIFGLTPPETMQWNARWIKDRLVIREMEETARAWVPELRRRGADLVICLAHSGISQPLDGALEESGAAAIAAIPGVDAVIAGHSHLTFPDHRNYSDPRINGHSGHIAGTPVVQPGQQGSHVGVIDLWLRHGDEGWKVVRSCSRVIAGQDAIAALPARIVREASMPLWQALAQDHSAALLRMRQRLGTVTTPISTWFANVADSQAMRLIGKALARHVRHRLEEGPLSAVPVVTLASAFRSGGRGGPLNYADISEGPISLRHVFSLYPFPNTLTAVLTTAASLAARLDQASALFNQITPGLQDQPLTNSCVPAFSFVTAVGASYQIDVSAPVGTPADPSGAALHAGSGRIRDLRIGGRLLAPDDPVILVLNNYITDDPERPTGRIVLDEGELCTDIIADYIRETRRISPDESPGWHFTPMPGTTVLYDTGTFANGRLDSAASLRPELLGVMPTGFSRFRLHL